MWRDRSLASAAEAAEVREEMVSGGCARVVVESLGYNLFRKNIQLEGLRALNNFALQPSNIVRCTSAVSQSHDCDHLQEAMGSVHSHTAIVNAMNEHRSCEAIQYYG